MNQISDRIRTFFEEFERANNLFRAELLDTCLGDPVVGADPHGNVETIGKHEYMAGIAERKAYMETLGFRYIKVVPLEEIPLSDSYSIVKVHGTMHLEETPGRPTWSTTMPTWCTPAAPHPGSSSPSRTTIPHRCCRSRRRLTMSHDGVGPTALSSPAQLMEMDAPSSRFAPWFLSRDFALLWTGQGISQLGDVVFDTTLVLWVATSIARGQSWAPLAVSSVFVAALSPPMLAGPFAGVLVDRWDKRHVRLATDAIRAVLITLLLLATRVVTLPFLPGGRPPPGWTLATIYAFVGIEATCAAFANPASFGLLSRVVGADQRTTAAARLEVNTSIAFVIGPPLAALIIGLGVEWALLLNALTFVVSFITIASIRPQRDALPEQQTPAASGFGQEMVEGLRFFARNRVLVTLSVSAVVTLIGIGALNALNVFFVT